MSLRESLSSCWSSIQHDLFPWLEERVGPLTAPLQDLVKVLEIARIGSFVPHCHGLAGRPPAERAALARAFVAKAVFNVATTRMLIDRVTTDKSLRRLCGWERAREIPSEATFSRAFAEFAASIPISCLLTAASLHDSQAAIPLANMTATRVTNLYDLMDSAYDVPEIREHSRALGHVAIIDINPRSTRGLKEELKAEKKRRRLVGHRPAEEMRYNERTTVERVNARIKDEFGGRTVRVRGHAKVICHLMFGIVALTVDQLVRFVT